MIKVQRSPKPKGFGRRARNWAKQFETERKKSPSLTISQFWSQVHPAIRKDAEALKASFHDKCAFCESYMEHVSAPHIEHYRPKQQYPDLAFDWDNWLLSCGRCNEIKWAHFPDCGGQPCLIDPTTEDPADHIEFSGYVPIPKTTRGDRTIELIGLDRSPLEDERSRWLMYLNVLLLLCTIPDFQVEARQLLVWSMQDNAPYAGMARCYLRQKAPRLAAQPHPPIDLHDPIERIQELTITHANSLSALQ